METFHTEESHSPSPDIHASQEQYAECPIESCGEIVSLAEMDYHVDLHLEEQRPAVDSSDLRAIGDTQGSNATPEVAPRSHVTNGPATKEQREATSQWRRSRVAASTATASMEAEKRLGVRLPLVIARPNTAANIL